jgi:hypothetical protein
VILVQRRQREASVGAVRQTQSSPRGADVSSLAAGMYHGAG